MRLSRIWYALILIPLVYVLVVSVAYVVWLTSRKRRPSLAQPQNSQGHGAEGHGKNSARNDQPSMQQIVRILQSVINEARAYRQQQERQGGRQYLLGLGTLIALIVAALIYGCLLNQTIRQTSILQGQLNETRRQTEITRRPWIKADIENLRLSPGQDIETRVHFENVGDTAARHLVARTYIETIKKDQAPSYGVNAIPTMLAQGVLFPHDESRSFANLLRVISMNPLKSENVKLTPDILKEYNPGNIYFAVYGSAEYSDIYDVPHWLIFCEPVQSQKYFSNANCAQHNDTDNNWSQEPNKTPRPF